LHDPLTGLGNRGLFHLKLAENFPTGRKSTPSLAVLALDLDKFKQVNDTMGHQAGDELLIRIGAIIQPLLGTHDTLIRLGGDEFAIIQPGIAGHGQPAALAQSIIEALARPISLAAGVARIGVSIGIATAPDLAHDQTELIRFADDALYRAKNGGRNRYCIYGSGETNEPARLDAQLREAFIARRSDSTPVSSQGPA
jgi:diguanylate cyclase (GGDEF)-like protein